MRLFGEKMDPTRKSRTFAGKGNEGTLERVKETISYVWQCLKLASREPPHQLVVDMNPHLDDVRQRVPCVFGVLTKRICHCVLISWGVYCARRQYHGINRNAVGAISGNRSNGQAQAAAAPTTPAPAASPPKPAATASTSDKFLCVLCLIIAIA